MGPSPRIMGHFRLKSKFRSFRKRIFILKLRLKIVTVNVIKRYILTALHFLDVFNHMKMRQCIRTSFDPGLKLLLSHGVWCWHHTEHKYMIMNLPGSERFVLNIGGLSEEDFFFVKWWILASDYKKLHCIHYFNRIEITPRH